MKGSNVLEKEVGKAVDVLAFRKMPNLDFMRSIAVLLVTYCHVLYYGGRNQYVGWSGTCGVGLFFVHTSLVLMWSLERDPHVGRFYLRRAFRIYPLWLVILGLDVLLHVPTSPLYTPAYGYYRAHGLELLQQALLVFNFFKGPTVVGASWTLPVEVDMYVVLPFVYFLIAGTKTWWPLLAVAGVLILFDVASYPSTAATLPACAPMFLAGPIAFALMKRAKPVLPAWSFVVLLSAVIAIWSKYGNFRVSWILALLVGVGLPFFRQVSWAPLVALSHQVAKYSYGVYLFHFVSMALAFHYLHAWKLPLRLCVFCASLMFFAVASYHLIEDPAIRFGRYLTEQRREVAKREMELEPAP